MMSQAIQDAARGRWPQILGAIGGISDEFLTGQHGPCPLCGGNDRWRWDDHGGNGGGYCNQCGGKDGSGGAISGLDLISRARGITFVEACKAVEQHLGVEPTAPSPSARRTSVTARRIPERPPAGAAPPSLDGATHQWLYEDAQGPCYWIQRIIKGSQLDKRGKPQKVFLHRVWLDGKWHRPSRKRDGFTCDWPAPRPLLGYPDLIERPDAPVLVVEGETTWDAARTLLNGWVAVTWSNGSSSVGLVDWGLLAGRHVVIWPDADPEGAKAAKRITELLQATGAASVAVVTPPDGVAKGWDLADAVGEGWAAERAAGLIEAAVSACAPEGEGGQLVEVPGGDGRATSEKKAAEDKPWPFALLGFAGDNFFYQPGESGQITAIAGAKHSSTQMLRLARLDWWLKHYPRKNDDGDTVGVNWQQAYDNLFERQYQVGYFDPDNVRGLGAWWDDGRTVLHLGDRLIVDGKAHPLNKALKSDYIYQRLRRLKGPSAAKPLSADEAMQVLETAGSFMWEEKPSAFLLAGWVALAPICGALRWRPHIWLTAGPGSGKSTIIERFVNVLIGDMGVHPEGQATEASIRQELVSSALPIVYDEADPNERSDRARLQAILSFARSCSSEGRGRIMKGSSDQSGAKKYQPKSMFLLSSVATALKQGADKSRFAQLTLKRDEKKTKAELESHWKQLDAALSATITDEFAKRLIARTIALIPMIRAAAEIFVVAAAAQLGSQRLGDQYGTLAAGAWSLQYEHVPSPEEAREWLQRNPLTSYADSTEVSDEKSCLETILEHQVRFDVDKGVKTVTVLTLIGIATQVPSLAPSGEDPITKDTAKRALGGVGIRVGDDGRLQISNTAKALRKLLADTSWENCWPTVLSRMEGATKEEKPRWFPGIGASRCVSLPMPALDDAGGDE